MSDVVSQNLNMIFKTPKGETVHALKDLNFTIKKGELLTVLGPSGCGKTTLLNITAGFIRPTSGKITLVPTPSSGFMYKLHYNSRPLGLSSANTTTFLSLNFGNGLLYACLVEAFSYLKGPMDMLQLYEQKYQTEVQKFGAEQLGRRRRDDYTDGEPRIPVPAQTP